MNVLIEEPAVLGAGLGVMDTPVKSSDEMNIVEEWRVEGVDSSRAKVSVIVRVMDRYDIIPAAERFVTERYSMLGFEALCTTFIRSLPRFYDRLDGTFGISYSTTLEDLDNA